MRPRRPRATTFYGHMRGPTLLLHRLRGSHSFIRDQLLSALRLHQMTDLTPFIGSLLSSTDYSSSSWLVLR